MEEKIGYIKECYAKIDENQISDFIIKYKDDTRAGVMALVEKASKRIEKQNQEISRTEAMKEYEYRYGEYEYICGIDEVGRGPLAGPVVAAAVILPKEEQILFLNDSKKLSEKKREELYAVIMSKAVAVGVGVVEPEIIDEINILQATYKAMRVAISNLEVKPDILLNDAVTIPEVDILQIPIIKGDAKSISIAAASIVAKVIRDKMMQDYEDTYPGYKFAENKGYGTKEHTLAIKELGSCKIHRKSFIKNFI